MRERDAGVDMDAGSGTGFVVFVIWSSGGGSHDEDDDERPPTRVDRSALMYISDMAPYTYIGEPDLEGVFAIGWLSKAQHFDTAQPDERRGPSAGVTPLRIPQRSTRRSHAASLVEASSAASPSAGATRACGVDSSTLAQRHGRQMRVENAHGFVERLLRVARWRARCTDEHDGARRMAATLARGAPILR